MIPALTVRQPWASQFFARPVGLAKDVENRGWMTGHHGTIAIHAGALIDEPAIDFLGMERWQLGERSVILGTVELTGCHLAGSPQCDAHNCRENPWAFFPDPADPGRPARIVHWMLEHPREFVTPIKASGARMLWEPTPAIAHLIETAEVVL